EEGGPGHCLHRGEHPGGHHGGDGVGRVVEAVDVVEDQRDQDDEDDQQQGPAHGRRGARAQAILRVMPSMTFTTSSQRSVTDSIVSYNSFHLMTSMASVPPSNSAASWSRSRRSASFSRRFTSTACL